MKHFDHYRRGLALFPASDGSDLLFAIQDQRRRQFDHRLFSLYFLVAETLATYLAYRIAQHCLPHCRLTFLSPSMRMLIGVLYCFVKVHVIDYAFHASAYFTGSVMIMLVYFLYAVAALGFHTGPLHFLFFDDQPPQATSVVDQMRFRLLQTLVEVEHQIPMKKSLDHGISQLQLAFGAVVPVKIDAWNDWMATQYAPTLVAAVQGAVQERRFVCVLQHDGLFLTIYLMGPTATTMMHLYVPDATTPVEIVLRFLTITKPVFFYAESPQLVGRMNARQQAAMRRLLTQLNACVGTRVDVPLRSLRCKNFVAADVGRVIRKKRKRPLSSAFEQTFG